ncbi:TadE family protein [Emcibacter sp. SYSU 3D8]|uniref:TadE/TadG family type IV pilus assembly protein n=1 Tax=Emcibacter sp. SYSU 3D8 TaxID=3133969 RepID=UPI0031FE9CE5
MATNRTRLRLAPTLSALRFRRERTGSAVVEFALLAPVLFLMLIGMFQFGIMINNYIQVTEGVRVAGRTLAISRGSDTPWTSTRTALFGSAPGLTQGNFSTISLKINGAPCVSDSNCKTKLTSAQGQDAEFMASYNCTSLIVYGTNFMPNCSLSSTTTIRIE